MQTYKHLYSQITAFENLFLAYKAARKRKRARPDVPEFEFDLEENLLTLQAELKDEKYEPGKYRNFWIHDPKARLISAAPFRDRVVHHALCRVIEPLFDRRFIHDSYACRKGKCTHAAIRRAQFFCGRYPYVLKCDVEHFFPRMDHQILYHQFERVLADEQALRQCKLILEGGAGIHREVEPAWFVGDGLFSALRPRSLPIGNLTSQFWANVYLNPLDHYIKRELKCPGYVRYVDDILLFSENKSDLQAWRMEIIQFLVPGRVRRIHSPRARGRT